MLSLNSSLRFYLYYPPTDMRRSFDGLCGLVQNYMEADPCNGDVYIFINKQRNSLKLLHWEEGGFALFYKRLETGTIEMPDLSEEVGSLHISWTDLTLMISGIPFNHVKKRKRYNLQRN
jgi:transposase